MSQPVGDGHSSKLFKKPDDKTHVPALKDCNGNLFEKTLMLGKIGGGEEKGTTEDEMVGWHHRLNGHGFG